MISWGWGECTDKVADYIQQTQQFVYIICIPDILSILILALPCLDFPNLHPPQNGQLTRIPRFSWHSPQNPENSEISKNSKIRLTKSKKIHIFQNIPGHGQGNLGILGILGTWPGKSWNSWSSWNSGVLARKILEFFEYLEYLEYSPLKDTQNYS